MYKHALTLALSLIVATPFMTHAEGTQRQAEITKHGEQVMPFKLAETLHIFTKTPDGGVQRVVARNANNTEQIHLIREHLSTLQKQFQAGDYSGPEHIHGQKMPGLDVLKHAQPSQLTTTYREVLGGAELIFHTADPKLLNAVHQWFSAQLSDHGHDAMEGHTHHHSDMQQ